MDLLIDLGNTRIKWAVQDGAGLGLVQRLAHENRFPAALAADWAELEPERVFLASVAAPSVRQGLMEFCRRRWALQPKIARPRARALGVTVAYAVPQQLGVDRWLALIAAHTQKRLPALIIDAGTAVTYDLLRQDGQHLGGLILPGLRMMRQSLLDRTQIALRDLGTETQCWAKDTASGIASGTLQALGALGERLAHQLAQVTGAAPSLLVTGGDGQRLQSVLPIPSRWEPDLVLQGLALTRDLD